MMCGFGDLMIKVHFNHHHHQIITLPISTSAISTSEISTSANRYSAHRLGMFLVFLRGMNLRYFFTICFLLSAIVVLKAQPKYDMGLHGGALISTIPDFSNAGFDKVSGTVGFVFTRRDKYKNYLQMEVNYIRKGAFRNPKDDNPDKVNLSLHYVEIPVFYRMETSFTHHGKESRGGIDFGLSYARLLSARMFRNGDQIAFNEMWSDKYDLSALFGVHVRVNNRMYLDARYSFSINPILRRNVLPNEITDFNSQQTHNHVIQVGVSFYMRGRYY